MNATKFNKCIERIKCKNTDGLELIYLEYYEKSKYTAFKTVKDMSSAEDIVSEFFRYIFEKAGTLPHIENPNAWFYKSICNRALSSLITGKRTENIENYAHTLNSPQKRQNLRLEFEEIFSNCTETEQNIVLLHYLYGFKYAEISKMLGRPVGTIKSDIHNVKAKFKALKEG